MNPIIALIMGGAGVAIGMALGYALGHEHGWDAARRTMDEHGRFPLAPKATPHPRHPAGRNRDRGITDFDAAGLGLLVAGLILAMSIIHGMAVQ